MNDEEAAVILDDVLVRRAGGEPLSDEDVLAAHPKHAEALARGLARLHLIEAARVEASTDTSTATVIGDCSTGPTSDGRAEGDRVGHYVLLEFLGEGGFGSVWLAWDEKLHRHVAFKLPRRESVDVDRFLREARLAAKIPRHPNVVSVWDTAEEGDPPFIASEFVDGVTLTDWLASERPEHGTAVDLCSKIADALDHIHHAGVVHRDLKPDNVLVDDDGGPRITDFGLSVQVADPRTPDKVLTGTPAYMAPEQVRGEPVDVRTDVHAIGLILFELLTGERPFRGDKKSVLREIEENEAPSPRNFDGTIPRDLETICLKCLEKSPERRYQTAGELREDLQSFRRHEPVCARPVTVMGRLARWCRRHPSIPLLSGTLLLAMLVAVVTAGVLLEREVDSMQERLQTTAQDGLDNSATTIQKLLESGLRERFRHVAEAANDDELRRVLRSANQRTPVPGSPDDEVQKWMEREEGIAKRTKTNVFSWFVCDHVGNQVARWERNRNTEGHAFEDRSYFTARLHDAPERGFRGTDWDKNDSEPRLSDVFLARDRKAWVLAISAPVWDDPSTRKKLLGVVGVFVSIRAVLDDVVPTEPGVEPTRFAYVLYQRDAGGDARIIDHPFQDEEDAREGEDGPIKWGIAELKLPPELCDDPDDPYELVWPAGDEYEIARSRARELFGREWLSASRLITPSEDEFPRLQVVVREARDLVTGPGRELRTNLLFFGLAILGLALAVLVPLWLVVARRLHR